MNFIESKNECFLLTQKQAVIRYGYSSSWFERARSLGDGPKFIKCKGKILYPLPGTDQWFLGHGLKSSTSDQPEVKNEEQ